MDSGQYFNQVAQRWEDMRSAFFPAEVRDVALKTAAVRAGQVALDVGAGSGFITGALVDAGLSVIAVDRSTEMLEVMRKRFLDRPVDLRRGDAEALPVDTASVDLVFANMCLHHVDHPGEAIKEMARVLKPGGGLTITDLDLHEWRFLLEEQHDRWPGFARQDVAGWFELAGLEDVVVACAGSNCCADSCTGKDSAVVSIFVAHGVKP